MGNRRSIGYITSAFILAGAAAVFLWDRALPPAVFTVTASKGTAVEAVYATAIVEPVTWAAIAPISTGRLVEVSAREGGLVRKGDILARMDDAPLQAELQEALARASYLEKEFARAGTLLEKGNISREKYDAVKSDLEQTQAHIKTHGEQIRQLSLTAPADGTVLWRDAEPGEVKQAGQTLFWIGQPRPLRLKAEVDEEDIPKIAPGQKVLISADAFPDEIMTGTVQSISPKGDSVAKSYRMYASLPDETKLMIGMSVETNTIAQEKEDAILIPAQAIGNGQNVWIAARNGKSHTARRIAVKTGISGKDMIEIPEGIEEGAVIILPPFTGLKEGAAVRIR